MADVIFEFDGTLDKFTGDGLMAIFGALVYGTADDENAIRAALRMRAVVQQLNDGRTSNLLPLLHIGMGIHTGDVVAGNIGSKKRVDYTVIGSTVNLACRLEQLNKKTQTDILISDATYRQFGELVDAKHLGHMGLRGVEKDISTYAVAGLRAPQLA